MSSNAVFSPIPVEPPDGGGRGGPVDLASVLTAALRRWKLILVFPLLAVALVYGALKLVPPLYKSTVEILIYDPQQQLEEAVQKRLSPFVDATDNVAMNTEVAVIQSKALALRVATELGLDRDPEFQPHNRWALLARRLGLDRLGWFGETPPAAASPEEARARRLDQAAGMLLEKLTVERMMFTYIIAVSVSSQNPLKAQRLADTIGRDFLAGQREARLEALHRVTAWLKGRLQDLQARVLQTEAAIAKLRSDHGLTDAGLSKVKDQQITEINAQLMAARGQIAAQRARVDQARRVVAANGDIEEIPELMTSNVITQLRQQQWTLNWRITQLRNRLGENHAEVVAARAQLAALNKQIAAESAHVVNDMQNTLDIAQQREQALEKNLKDLTAPTEDSPAQAKLRQMERLTEADRKLYEIYLSQYNEVSQRRTLEDTSARIVNPASVPDAPYFPRRIKFYAIAIALGLIGGVGLVVLREFLQSGVKTNDQVEKSFGLPVVGLIPFVRRREFVGGGRDNRLVQAIVNAPLSQLSEAVRAIRIGLDVASADWARKVLLVTSALPAEGKSTAAMLLAASSATSGHKTVLLDCDLRRQAISRGIGKDRPGLSDLLRGTAQLADVVLRDRAIAADVIPAGSPVRNPADLLMSPAMRNLVARLRDSYDYVVVDASPLLPVVDALALATMVDKILVVVEWSRTPRAAVAEAFKVLRPEAGRIAGIVLNKVDLKQVYAYGYRGGYPYRSRDKDLVGAGSGR